MNLTPTTPVDDDNTEPGPFIELSRESWAALSDSTEIDIDEATLDHIRGLGDPTSHRDVGDVVNASLVGTFPSSVEPRPSNVLPANYLGLNGRMVQMTGAARSGSKALMTIWKVIGS